MSAADAIGVTDGVADIAARFVSARLSKTALPDYPGERPLDMATAYATQEVAIGLFPDEIIGWKVDMVPAPQQPTLQIHRLSGPIFSRNLWMAKPEPTPLPAIPGGFAAVEAEFVAKVGKVDPDKLDWTLEEATSAVAALHIGVELAASALPTINDLGSAVVASDFGNNGGLILGPEIEDWRSRLSGIEVETVVDGKVIGAATADAIPLGILESVRFLLEHLARRGRPAAEGTLISTGAVTGVHSVQIGAQCICAFSSVGEIRSVIVEAKA